MLKIFACCMFFFTFGLPLLVAAQTDSTQIKYTAFAMRSNGKIYVVVAVILIILFGLLLYLVRLDRKISRLEKNNAG